MPKICQNVKRGIFYCIKCYVFHMASIKYHKSFTKPVAFTVGLLTVKFCESH